MINTVGRRKGASPLANLVALVVVVAASALIAGCGDSAKVTGETVIPGQTPGAPKLTPGAPPGGMPGAGSASPGTTMPGAPK